MSKHINPKLRAMYEKNNRFLVVLSVLLFVLLAYFSYSYFSELSQVKKDIASLEKIEDSLAANLSESSVEFTDKSELYNERRKTHVTELNKVFPMDAEKTEFTRFLDDYFFKNNFSSNEIFVKNMIFGKPTVTDTYTMMPVSLSITSSKANFTNFLEFVENSGALSSNTRVMDIQAIDVTFREDDDKELYDYRLSLNMYYQKINESES